MVCISFTAWAIGQEPAAKTKVELRWCEWQPVAGVTEEEGFQTSCDPKSLAYPHKKPALVLTAAEVSEARLSNHDFSKGGLSSDNYLVKIELTKEARAALASACGNQNSRVLTVVIDGRNWGLHRYEKLEGLSIPEQVTADKFVPAVGFFSSRAEAERLVKAFK